MVLYMTNTNEIRNAGFWIRLLATWFDLLIVYLALKLIFYLLLLTPGYFYFPFGFTYIVLTLIYSTVSVAWKGQTLGKKICHLIVLNKDNARLPVFKPVVRETVLKLFSGIAFFLGFTWIAFSRSKKGWHDYIAGSKVIFKRKPNRKLLAIQYTIGILILGWLLGGQVVQITGLRSDIKQMKLVGRVEHPHQKRSISELKEISTVANTEDSIYIDWLNKNEKAAESYAIEIASKHKVTIFGESHGWKTNLDFFNKIIPDLYYKAGVRCIALEFIPMTENSRIEKLINGQNYDQNLALSIARNQPWKMWGGKEYWDILETVWKLNRSIPEEDKKIRVVGIDTDWDGPSFALLGLGEDGLKNTAAWEKLRIFTLVDDFIKLQYRDELMAKNVEKEIIEKGDKGVVWIGANHSFTHYGQPKVRNSKLIGEFNRMGVMLYQKYRDDIFQIVLHGSYVSNTNNFSISDFIERIMTKRYNPAIGFNVENSPFATLRDNNASYFQYQPQVGFGDLAQGYIFLRTVNKLEKCTWMEKYVSKQMYMRYKPFYENKLTMDNQKKIKFKNSNEINDFMSKNGL